MANVKDAKITDLVFDDKNLNKHTEFGMSLIERSMRNNGAGRSILIDKNNRIIAGNGVTEIAGQIGMDDVQIVESDGTKIIAVKRTDIDLDTKQGREMALADNATAAADLAWDADTIADVSVEFDIDVSGWGVFVDDAGDAFFKGERKGERTDEYDEFEDKFKPKLTTDDCYTPTEVYDEVCKYVRNIVGDAPEFVRPFYPGGDYQKYKYPKGCVVVDNPPFSIYAEIVRWYLAHDIKFFLFCPALTQIVSNADVNYCVTSANVIYENGANVRTSFTTNLLGDIAFMTTPKLKADIELANKQDVPELPQYNYPNNVVTTALLAKISKGNFKVLKDECQEINNLDALKDKKKSLYGKGWLLNDKKAKEKNEEQERLKQKAAEDAMLKANEGDITIENGKVTLALSDREIKIIEKLNHSNG